MRYGPQPHATRRGVASGIVLGLAVALSACGSSTEPDPSSGGSMTALIDGSSFQAVTINDGGGDPSTLNIVGTTATSSSTVEQISLFVTGITGAGTFALDATSSPASLALVTITTGGTPSQWSTTSAAGPGSVTITTFTDSRAAGTFQFVADADAGTAASGQVSVTNGAFDISR